MALHEYSRVSGEEGEGKTVGKYGLFSLLFHSWMGPVVSLGNKQPLEHDDLVPFPGQWSTRDLTDRLERLWTAEMKRAHSPRLWIAVLKLLTAEDNIFLLLSYLLYTCCRFFKPIFLFCLLTEVMEEKRSTMALVYGAAISGCLVMELFVKNHYYVRSYMVAAHVRSALTGLIYRKILVSSENKIAETTSGHVINLVSKDLDPIVPACGFFMFFLVAPFEVIVTSCLLWYFIGRSTLAGMGVMLFALIIQVFVGIKFQSLRDKIAAITDQRLKQVTDVISGIRVVKMNAWEPLFQRLTDQIRRKEINFTQRKTLIFSTLLSLVSIYSAVITFVAMATMVVTGHHLTSRDIFTTYLLISTLKKSAIENFTDSIFYCSQSLVSCRRIQAFLMAEHKNIQDDSLGKNYYDEVVLEQDSTNKQEDTSVTRKSTRNSFEVAESLKGNNVSWGSDTIEKPSLLLSNVSHIYKETVFLRNFNLHVQGNKLVTVTGPVGSGKTSFFSAVIGELCVAGDVRVSGRIAHVPQRAWLYTGTLRQNILFGEKFDEQRYGRVVEACGLRDDLNEFPQGDLTLVGERGASLSGGQRSRVSLARACYSDADIFLLDDPLSALDANISAHVFANCISGLLRKQLRILITHEVEHLAKADLVVVMKGGSAVAEGSYAELLASDDYIAYLNSLAQQRRRNFSTKGRKGGEEKHEEAALDFVHSTLKESEAMDGSKEDRDVGTVSYTTYWRFLRAGASIPLILLAAMLFILAEGALVSSNVWLSHWSKMSFEDQSDTTSFAIYGSLMSGAALLAVGRALLFSVIVLQASKNLHYRMLLAILKAPIRFFDTTPTGRILNRFSKDTGCMDETLPNDMFLSIQLVVSNIAALLLLSSTAVYINIASIPFLIAVIYITKYGLRASREMKRLEAIAASPLYAHISETIQGLVTIRNHHKEETFVHMLYSCTDRCNAALISFLACKEWMSMRTEAVCSVYASCVILISVLMGLDEGITGLTITYSCDFAASLFWTIQVMMMTEYWMTSVQRVMTYTEIESEPGYEYSLDPQTNWPCSGKIQLKDTSLRYHPEGPRTLKGLSLSIRHGEKIGVVGRTGAGKSSLIAALMRMPEHEGEIIIDDVKIKELNLQKLRVVVSVINQNPFLFTGTLRFNLDPYDKYSDKQLWEALEETQLKSLVQETQDQLCCCVSENGSNFSAGERQLICLARAMLQENKIIILDEATASIDFKTEKLIHDVVRTKFVDCTVITIAHRLDTLLDHDRVLVLDRGEIVEFDDPKVLLTHNNGYLAKLFQAYSSNVST